MKQSIFILLFLHLSMHAHAQVYNKTYNNYSNVFHRQNTNEYLNNYDALHSTIVLDSSQLSFGNSMTPYIFGDSFYINTFLVKTNHFGDTTMTKSFNIDTFEVSSISTGFYFNDKCVLFGRVKMQFGPTSALKIEIDSDLNLLSYNIYNFGFSSLFFDYYFDSLDNVFFGLANVDIDTTPTNSNYDIFIIKFNISGNAFDTLQLGYIEDDLGAQIMLLSNGNLLLCGQTTSIGAGDEDIYLAEIDTLGNIVWEQTYGYPGTDRVLTNSCFVVNNQKEIYIVGSTELMDGDRAGWLIKTDSLGNMLWEKKYNWGEEFDALTTIKKLDDNTLLVLAGTHDYSFQNSPPPIMRMLKMDTAGNIIWERKLSRYGLNNTDDYAYDLDIMNDGFLITGYVIAGHVQTNGIFHANDGWLCKTDSCGFTTGAQPQALLTVDSVVGTTVYISNLSEEYCTAKLLLGNGDSLNIYAYSQWTNGNDPTQLEYTFADTGNYNLTLYTYAGDGIDSFSTQVEVKDTATSIHNVLLAEAGISMSVYPNPAKDYIILQADFGIPQQVRNDELRSLTGELYTITGQKVHEFAINPKLLQQKIALPDLNNGVYFLKIKTKNYTLATERISVVK